MKDAKPLLVLLLLQGLVACGNAVGAEEAEEATEELTGTYLMEALHSGQCADVEPISSSTGASVVQWTCAGGTRQQWRLKALSNGAYNLVSVHSGLCLDVTSKSLSNGGSVEQWTCNG